MIETTSPDMEACIAVVTKPAPLAMHWPVLTRSPIFTFALAGAPRCCLRGIKTRSGGGIVSTVAATRAASEDALFAAAQPRLAALAAEGVTAVEIKSGYGLDVETELKQLRVARRLGEDLGITVRTTFLGAHALPQEFAGRADDYIGFVCAESLPAAAGAGLADAVDAFCESIAFSPEQTARVFDAAQALGLPVKLHADQLSDLGGAALAARFGALSADHLEFASGDGAAAMAEAGTVAVLLPGAFYFLRETKLPPIEAFRKAGVPMALATDSNPGSAPVTSLLLMPPRREGPRDGRDPRHPGDRQGGRPLHLGYRAAGRAGLPHRLQSPRPAHQGRDAGQGRHLGRLADHQQ